MPGFPQAPLSASGYDGNEDSQFDLMDIKPDFKITPSSWKQNQLTENIFDLLGREGLPEHSTDPNPLSTSSHISSSVAFVGPAQNREASVEEDDSNRGLDQVQTRNISRKPTTENVTPMFNPIVSKVSGFSLRQLAQIAPEPSAAHQEVVPKSNRKDKRSTIAASTSLFSKLLSSATSTDQAVASHPDPIGAPRQAQSETVHICKGYWGPHV